MIAHNQLCSCVYLLLFVCLCWTSSSAFLHHFHPSAVKGSSARQHATPSTTLKNLQERHDVQLKQRRGYSTMWLQRLEVAEHFHPSSSFVTKLHFQSKNTNSAVEVTTEKKNPSATDMPASTSGNTALITDASQIPKVISELEAQTFNWRNPAAFFTPQWSSRIILLVVSAFYGTNFGCVKILGESLHPGVAASFRFTIAALVFLPQLIAVFKSNRKLVMGGIEVGLYTAIGYFAQAQSLISSHASNVAFICSLAVIVVPIIESTFGEKRGFKYLSSALLPALLAVAGVGCLELGGTDLPKVSDLWAMLQPLFFGLSFWRIERHMKICSQPGEAQAFTGAMMVMVALMSYIWTMTDFVIPISHYGHNILEASLLSQFHNVIQNWKVPVALAWTGIVTTALTSYGENIAMKNLDAAESTVIYSTEPLWGAAFASVTLGESIGLNTVLGAFLILAACLWSSLGATIISMVSSTFLVNNAEVVEEIGENISANLSEILERIPDITNEM